jgi:hypothetical protein
MDATIIPITIHNATANKVDAGVKITNHAYDKTKDVIKIIVLAYNLKLPVSFILLSSKYELTRVLRVLKNSGLVLLNLIFAIFVK